VRPLQGIRVADFTIHAAGPFATHLLAQLGAEVIKIESSLRPDIFRKPHAVYGRLEPASFDQVASGKLSVRLNLKDRRGRDLARRIVAVSQVAAESFRPGVMAKLGLSWDDLVQLRSDLVMVSVSSSGQTGPDAHFAGYAPLFGAWGGLGLLTGHADGPPVEMRHVMDHSVGLNAAVAVLAALARWRSSGEGSYVDVAAREVAASVVGSALTEAASGGVPLRYGNRSPAMCPHGVFPTRDEDGWVAVAVQDDRAWAALVSVVGGHPPIPATADLTARESRVEEIERYVSDWTSGRSAQEATDALQRVGVAAHPTSTAGDLVADPHLRARRALVRVTDSAGHERTAVGLPLVFSTTTDVGIHRGTPRLGQDEEYVFGELLGLGRSQRAELEADGVIV
jgi:crotonobetainyl-CoA:carnitine CoA-transferase CaiB-like acyl-CoA transferase